MNEFRTQILDKTEERAKKLFGPSGSRGRWFREVERGPWIPPATTRPKLTIVDDGQKRLSGEDDFQTVTSALSIKMILEISADWSDGKTKADWSDRVDQLIKAFHNWVPAGCAVERFNYEGDDPMDVIFTQSAESEAIWIIEFEVKYFDQALDLAVDE